MAKAKQAKSPPTVTVDAEALMLLATSFIRELNDNGSRLIVDFKTGKGTTTYDEAVKALKKLGFHADIVEGKRRGKPIWGVVAGTKTGTPLHKASEQISQTGAT